MRRFTMHLSYTPAQAESGLAAPPAHVQCVYMSWLCLLMMLTLAIQFYTCT